MSYLIYMKRSFKHRFKSHMMLYAILTCAIILPLIISIFRDSIIFGQESEIQQHTRGQTYHVINAKPEYLKYFKNIQGVSVYYEDNTIFINIASEEDMNNSLKRKEFDKELFNIINEIKDDRLLLMDMSQLGKDESFDKGPNQLLFVNAFIMIISLIIIQSAYKYHFNGFSVDIGILVSCGAENRQIKKIFIFAFLNTFIIAALSAVIISSALMYLLFRYFIQVKDIGNLSWLIFRINPLSLLGHILVFGIALFIIVLICLAHKLNQVSIKMLYSSESGEKIKHYKKMLVIEKNSVKSLGMLLSQRTKSRFISCLTISIPITIASLFIFNYLSININSVSKSPDYEITMLKDTLRSSETGISKEDIAFVNRIDGVKNVKEELNLPTTKYILKDDRMEGESLVVYGEEPYAQTFIHSYNDIEYTLRNKNFNSNKYNIAINKNHKYLKYKIGDKIYLYFNEIRLEEEFVVHGENEKNNNEIIHDYAAGGLSITSKPIELTVTQLLDYEWTDRMFSIYFTDEMYQELTKDEPVLTLQLILDNPSESKTIESILRSKFASIEYTITNNYAMYEKSKEASMGIYIMALFIFALMFAFTLVILYVKLSDYVVSQSGNIRLFYILGASKSEIYDSYMRLPLNISMLSVVISFLLGLGSCILFFQNTGYHLIMNVTTIGVHLIIAMLILVAFNVPVHLTLKNTLKQF